MKIVFSAIPALSTASRIRPTFWSNPRIGVTDESGARLADQIGRAVHGKMHGGNWSVEEEGPLCFRVTLDECDRSIGELPVDLLADFRIEELPTL
jgi:hypothetical protein